MILKIVLPVLTLLVLYYAGLFIYYYRKSKSAGKALKNTTLLMLPVLVVLFVVEFTFRVVVSNAILHKDDRFFTRNFATAYYFMYRNSFNHLVRYIRLREPKPGRTLELTSPQGTLVQYMADKDGFIEPEYKNGSRTIFFVGGSTTECALVVDSLRFSYLVGRNLAKHDLNYTTKNAGFLGNNTFHSINNIINKILPYHPRAIVLMEAINDLTILLREKSYHNKNSYRSLVLDDLFKNQHYQAGDEFADKRGKVQTLDTNIIFPEYRKALVLFINVCRAQEIRPILMTQFNRMEPQYVQSCKHLRDLVAIYNEHFREGDYISLYKRMNEVVREVSVQHSVPLIDLDQLVPKSDKYLYDAIHLSDSGSVLVANIISEHLATYMQPQSLN